MHFLHQYLLLIVKMFQVKAKIDVCYCILVDVLVLHIFVYILELGFAFFSVLGLIGSEFVVFINWMRILIDIDSCDEVFITLENIEIIGLIKSDLLVMMLQ